MATPIDVLILGGGHNGLVAAALLSQRKLKVTVVDARPVLGGAAVTEQPFGKAPALKQSTGSYLLGMMPPELMAEVGVTVPTLRRDPHYFVPTTDRRYLLFGSNRAELKEQFTQFFSARDWEANERFNGELGAIRDDLAPAWLQPPVSLEETAERFIRPALRQAFVDLCRGSARAYLERFGFQSDLVKAMYAVTDAFSGVDGGYDTPGTGMNLLVHNMCRLPGADGTWMIAKGGMGSVSRAFATKAAEHGATLRTDARVSQILVERGRVTGVRLANGEELKAKTIISNADPFATTGLLPEGAWPAPFQSELDSMRADGSTMKVNLALKALPTFTCLPEDRGQFGTTIHLLPDERSVLKELDRAYQATKNGHLPEFPSIEWYIHTTVDPSLSDGQHHSSALFVEWVPYTLAGGKTWEEEESRYAQHLISLCDRFAPGFSDLVVDTFVLTPKKIESYFGITRGHIHHVDNKRGFDRRVPYQTPIDGLFFCSAGCHPAGGVIGAAGYNAAKVVLKQMGIA